MVISQVETKGRIERPREREGKSSKQGGDEAIACTILWEQEQIFYEAGKSLQF